MKKDLELVCVGSQKRRGCGKRFVWYAYEQEFLQELYDSGKRDNPPIAPIRCEDCRTLNKAFFAQTNNRNLA